jgi:hypothetical protein
VLVAFVPPAILTALGGTAAFWSFFADMGAHSRFFIVIPLLVLGEPLLILRLDRVAAHFLHDQLITASDRSTFEAAFLRFTRLRSSFASQVAIVSFLYMVFGALIANIDFGPLLIWIRDKPRIQNLSPAGLWYFYVSLPIICFYLLRATWCQLLWALFLKRVARLDLQLIPSHPDHLGGLGFIQTCLEGYYPLVLAFGTILAGGVANHVIYVYSLPGSADRYDSLSRSALCISEFVVADAHARHFGIR